MANLRPALKTHSQRVVAAESVAALIVEPVQGEGGFIVPPPGWLTGGGDICRKHGILFIADEVQTGFARTGKMFAIEHEGIEPDLIVTAKSLGGGLPLAAVTGKARSWITPHRALWAARLAAIRWLRSCAGGHLRRSRAADYARARCSLANNSAVA